MSSDTVISVSNLSKSYRLGTISSRTLREDLTRVWARLLRKPDPLSPLSPRSEDGRSRIESRSQASALRPLASDRPSSPVSVSASQRFSVSRSPSLFWALRDVSFEVKQGEVLGIIGANGAGKSTLLKILSRITAPTAGELRVKGRIASLLEIGTGFHPDLTGRENLFLNGAILGMTKAEIRSKFDEIVAFSEVEQFIDTPVKRYSSGMYVRLAFAVAAHLEPEILVIDEVLSVGDATFQRKCLGKMGEVARHGRTVLFVSHNMVAVQSLCNSAILLKEGRIDMAGATQEVSKHYLAATGRQVVRQEWDSPENAPGNESFRIKSVALASKNQQGNPYITVQTAFEIEVRIWALRPAEANLSLAFIAASGETVFANASPVLHLKKKSLASYRCHVPSNLLNDGTFSVNVLIVEDSAPQYALQSALVFDIHDVAREGHWLGRWPGVVRPSLPWETISAEL